MINSSFNHHNHQKGTPLEIDLLKTELKSLQEQLAQEKKAHQETSQNTLHIEYLLKEKDIDASIPQTQSKAEALELKNKELVHANNKNTKNQRILETMLSRLKTKENDLQEKNNQLIATEEELRQQTEEILAQREALEENNLELKKANSKTLLNQRILKSTLEKLQNNELVLRDKNSALRESQEELEQRQEEIIAQRDLLGTQNKDLAEKTHQLNCSIRAALTIQQAILPTQKELATYFPKNFVMFKPHSIVSGDFFWLGKISDSKAIVIVADCTGHGVPGAFMSLIGNNILSEAVYGNQLTLPSQILEFLNEQIYKRLSQGTSNNQDGMDLGICLFENLNDPNEIKITYGGSKNQLYYLPASENEVKILKSDRIGIGGLYALKTDKSFTDQVIQLKKGSRLYLISDGIIDQCNNARRAFGKRRFLDVIENNKSLSLPQQKETILKTLSEFQENAFQRDDITVVGLEL